MSPFTSPNGNIPAPEICDIDGSTTRDESQRQGTISSARFNLLSSMVGGGSLSLPLAFHQTGNMLVAPLLLIATGAIAQQSIIFLIKAGIYSTGSSENSGRDNNNIIAGRMSGARDNRKGTASYENVAMQAFGPHARIFSMALVSACCFFGSIGYCVLLRDMLEPIMDGMVTPPEGTGGGPTLARNAAMLTVVFFVTPLCTLRNLTALQNVGAASMLSVFTVASCVAFRSIECQLKPDTEENADKESDQTIQSFRAFPLSAKELLDAAPLFISSYICHFNVLPIHNELRCPTSDRVKKWVRTSIWPATLFYWFIGFTGSLYIKCTPSGRVSGNVLLDFDEDDPLLLLGRLCLAVTITLALPMLVIPARDILVRSLVNSRLGGGVLQSLPSQHPQLHEHPSDIPNDISQMPGDLKTVEFEPMEISQRGGGMEEPLLVLENRSLASVPDFADPDLVEELSLSSNLGGVSAALAQSRQLQMARDGTDSKSARRFCAVIIFWSSAFIACSVKSIDVVWDLLGSSFSIMMAFLIPCGAYLKLSRMKRFNQPNDGGVGFRSWMVSRTVAWLMLLFFTPLMFVSTINAVYNNFFSEGK